MGYEEVREKALKKLIKILFPKPTYSTLHSRLLNYTDWLIKESMSDKEKEIIQQVNVMDEIPDDLWSYDRIKNKKKERVQCPTVLFNVRKKKDDSQNKTEIKSQEKD